MIIEASIESSSSAEQVQQSIIFPFAITVVPNFQPNLLYEEKRKKNTEVNRDGSLCSSCFCCEYYLQHPEPFSPFHFSCKGQTESLGEKLDFLLDFVKNHHSHGGNEEAKVLESQIASVAHAAEDVIESHIVDRIEPLMAGSNFANEETNSSLLLELLMNVMLHIKSHPRLSTSLDRKQIESLGEKLDFLLNLIENPNFQVGNEEKGVLERQIPSQARAVEDALNSQMVRLKSYQCVFTSDHGETVSSFLLDFLVIIMEQIVNYPRFWTCLDSKRIVSFGDLVGEILDDIEEMGGQIRAIVAEDVIESQEAGSTFDPQKEIKAMKIKVMKVHEKICRNKVVICGSGNCFLPDLEKVLKDMDSLKEKVIKVKEERGLKDLLPTCSTPAASSSSLTAGKANVVGFESYFDQLLDWLTAEQSDQQIIPITGMGGIGKTTLARKVYADLLIVQHFYVRAWLTISQEYNVRQLLFHTLSSLGKSTEELVNKTEDELGVLLHKILYGRRYLIILDDIWSIESWEKISFYFPREEKRSRIVVTTRQADVANHFGSVRLALRFLDDDKSWDLFCEKAFEQGCCPSELEYIGRRIVKRCRGLPLSIVVIGGLLGKSFRTREHWMNVEKDLSSILNMTEDNQCFNILSLSYSYLPSHLKPCFLFLGRFPEDHEIRVSRLIKLWVAEGFLKPNKGPSLEEVAKSYIEDLADKNLLLIRKLSTNGKVKTCSLHDLLRDLCIKIAEKEKFFCLMREVDTPRDRGRKRRLISLESMAKECHPLQSTSLVRSVVGEFPCHLSSKSRLLRVFSNAHHGSPDMAFQQVNLRFLECPPNLGTYFYKLPSSISLLWSLQTLIIATSHVEVEAPSEIWEMEQLRHLRFHRAFLHKPPLSDKKDRVVLRNLQTLKVAWIFKFSKEVCKRMPNIKKLSIIFNVYLWGQEDSMAYNCFYNICHLTKLESLHFDSMEVPRYFSQNLRLPSSLKKLALRNCQLKWDDLTRIGSLPHLEVLKLDCNSVVGAEWNPIEGEFQRLKYLQISDCYDLRQWNAESCHFPVLEKLVVEHLSKLDEIPSGFGDIPTLGDIYLQNCSVSAVMSAMSILKEQESYGNEDLQVRVKFLNGKEREAVRKKIELEGFSNHKFQLVLV